MPLENRRLCGAKTRKGVPCQDLAMANGRCKRHGGKSTGAANPNPPSGELHPAYAYGIYGKYLNDDDKALIDAKRIKAGEVEDELQVMRIRLKRTLEARAKWEAEKEASRDGSAEHVLIETVEGTRLGPKGDLFDVDEKTFRVPDFDAIIDRTVARIESLEKTRLLLLGGGEPTDPESGMRVSATVVVTGGLPERK